MSSITVWTFLTEKKCQKIRFDLLQKLAPPSVTFKLINPSQIDMMIDTIRTAKTKKHIVLHKISDFAKEELAEGVQEINLDELLQSVEERFSDFKDEIRVINSLDGLKLVSDRWKTYQFFLEHLKGIKVPLSIQYSASLGLKKVPFSFPVLWKPISACGHPGSHDMLYIPISSSPLKEVSQPGLIQEFIRHHGILYKVFVVGDRVSVDIRPSLIPEHFETFGNQTFDSTFVRTLRPLSDLDLSNAEQRVLGMSALIEETSKILKEKLDMELFGWDLIISEQDGSPYIIDVNNFPKFDGFPNFHEALLSLILSK